LFHGQCYRRGGGKEILSFSPIFIGKEKKGRGGSATYFFNCQKGGGKKRKKKEGKKKDTSPLRVGGERELWKEGRILFLHLCLSYHWVGTPFIKEEEKGKKEGGERKGFNTGCSLPGSHGGGKGMEERGERMYRHHIKANTDSVTHLLVKGRRRKGGREKRHLKILCWYLFLLI